MASAPITYAAFMKHCRKETTIDELGKLVSGLGFNGIELGQRSQRAVRRRTGARSEYDLGSPENGKFEKRLLSANEWL